MIAFRGKKKLGHPQIGLLQGLIQNFRPFYMGVPLGALNEPGTGTTYDWIGSRDL